VSVTDTRYDLIGAQIIDPRKALHSYYYY